MAKQNRKTGSLGRAGAFAVLFFLAAGLALGISPRDGQGRRRQAMRESRIAAMDVFGSKYGGVDWSPVMGSLAERPGDAGNPRIMSIFLSLGNVDLNRFELRHSAADLDRAIGFFEAVAGSADLWGKRPLSGSVVAYLGISLVRLEGECDVGQFRSRVEELRQKVIEVSGNEADAVAPLEEYMYLIETTPEEDAARAALYAAAANLQPEDPRGETWRLYARLIAERLALLDSQTEETALSLSQAELLYELSGGDIPRVFERNLSRPRFVVAFRGSSSVSALREASPVRLNDPEDSLERAVGDSRILAALLSEYLREFPPGEQCEIVEGE